MDPLQHLLSEKQVDHWPSETGQKRAEAIPPWCSQLSATMKRKSTEQVLNNVLLDATGEM